MRGLTALPVAGLVIGMWALLPPYTGPSLAVEPRVEVADHVVPGIVVIVVSVAALLARRRALPRSTPMFVAGLVIALAGLWMFATHVPLLVQANDGLVPFGTALWHSVPGLVVMVLGGLWAVRNGAEPEAGAGAVDGEE